MKFTSLFNTISIVVALLGLAACSQESSDTQETAANSATPIAAPDAVTQTAVGGVTDADLINAANEAEEWLSYGRDYGETGTAH